MNAPLLRAVEFIWLMTGRTIPEADILAGGVELDYALELARWQIVPGSETAGKIRVAERMIRAAAKQRGVA